MVDRRRALGERRGEWIARRNADGGAGPLSGGRALAQGVGGVGHGCSLEAGAAGVISSGERLGGFTCNSQDFHSIGPHAHKKRWAGLLRNEILRLPTLSARRAFRGRGCYWLRKTACQITSSYVAQSPRPGPPGAPLQALAINYTHRESFPSDTWACWTPPRAVCAVVKIGCQISAMRRLHVQL